MYERKIELHMNIYIFIRLYIIRENNTKDINIKTPLNNVRIYQIVTRK